MKLKVLTYAAPRGIGGHIRAKAEVTIIVGCHCTGPPNCEPYYKELKWDWSWMRWDNAFGSRILNDSGGGSRDLPKFWKQAVTVWAWSGAFFRRPGAAAQVAVSRSELKGKAIVGNLAEINTGDAYSRAGTRQNPNDIFTVPGPVLEGPRVPDVNAKISCEWVLGN